MDVGEDVGADQLTVVLDGFKVVARTLITEGATVPNRRTYIFVNNRLEGSAPWTISEMVTAADGLPLG